MNLSENLNINAQELITGRTCILAQSGGGKSYGIGVICEELSRQKYGYAIIDTEGEYSSLKQKFEVLWVGMDKKCDLKIDEINLDTFAKRIIQSNMAVIFDVSEVMDLTGFVDEICKAIYKRASELRMPYLLIVEEADKFAPQKSGKVIGSLNEIARRGRKRGLGLMLASQRPAFVNKDVLSQCNNQFIGRLTIQNDLNAVKQFFNNRNDLLKLPDLNYKFFAMGSIVDGKDILFKFKKRETKHGGLTPSIRTKKTKNVIDFIKEMKEQPLIQELSITPKIDFNQANKIAERKLKKKFIFLGKKTERIVNLQLELMPLIEAIVEIKNKGLFGSKLNKIKVLFDAVSGRLTDYKFNVYEDTSYLIDMNNIMYNILKLLKKQDLTKYGLESKLNANIDKEIKLLEEKKYISSRKERSDKRIKVYSLHYSGRFYKTEDFNVKNNYSVKKIDAGKIIKPLYKIEHLKKIISAMELDFVIKEYRIIYYPFYIATIRNSGKPREIRINGITGKVL